MSFVGSVHALDGPQICLRHCLDYVVSVDAHNLCVQVWTLELAIIQEAMLILTPPYSAQLQISF